MGQAGHGKILVIRGGAIGDFILTLPAIAALRQQFLKARLEVLGYGHIARLAVAGGLVDEVRSIESAALAGFFARGGQLAPNLAEYFGEFAIIISYLYDPDRIFETNVRQTTKAQFITGPHRPAEAEAVHATEVFLRPLSRLAIFESDATPRLRGLERGPDVSSQAERPLIVHPGSGSEAKNWPENRWRQLLCRIVRDTNWNLVLVGGEAEGNQLERLAALVPATRMRVAKNLPLTELAGVMAEGVAFLGHDSGISHLCAALGLPGVVLWGETNPVIWRPRGEKIELLTGGKGLLGVEVGHVFQALRPLMG